MTTRPIHRSKFLWPGLLLAGVLVTGLLSMIAPGCLRQKWSAGEKPTAMTDVTGVWRLDAKNLRSGNYTAEDFKDFSLTLHADGRFESTGIPAGLLLNNGKQWAAFEGRWKLRDETESYLDLTMTNLPGYTSGTFSRPLEWKDGRRVLRIGEDKGFIFIVRDTTTTP